MGTKRSVLVDEKGLPLAVVLSGANTHDVTMVPKLLTGEETAVYGDSGYLGAEKQDDAIIRNTKGKKIKYKIAFYPISEVMFPKDMKDKCNPRKRSIIGV